MSIRYITEISILILQLSLVDLFTFTRSYLIALLDPFLSYSIFGSFSYFSEKQKLETLETRKLYKIQHFTTHF